MMLKTNFFGDGNIGLYGYASDKYCLLGCGPKGLKKIREALRVPVHASTFMNTQFAGMFSAGNSRGIVASKLIYEIKRLEEKMDVLALDTRYTALGNLVLMNDKGIILSPLLKRHKNAIGKFFGLPCEISKVAGLNVV